MAARMNVPKTDIQMAAEAFYGLSRELREAETQLAQMQNERDRIKRKVEETQAKLAATVGRNVTHKLFTVDEGMGYAVLVEHSGESYVSVTVLKVE